MKPLLDSFNFALALVGAGACFRLGWLLVDHLWYSAKRRRQERISLTLEQLLTQLERPSRPSGQPEKPRPTGGRLIRSDRDPGSPKS